MRPADMKPNETTANWLARTADVTRVGLSFKTFADDGARDAQPYVALASGGKRVAWVDDDDYVQLTAARA